MQNLSEGFPDSMTAVVCHGPRDYRVQTIARPAAGPCEMVIRIGACGICASDCKCWSGAKMFWGANPWVKAPVVPGHEFFGTVESLGEGAARHFGVAAGERVIAEQIVPCDRCRYCRSGQYWMCEVHNIFGFQREVADGGMAQFMRIPSTARVHRIPDEMPLEDAAIIEPLACAIHAVNRGDIQLDDVVVIAGAGPIGLMMVQVARLKTPRRLVVIDMVAERLALAKQYGADVIVNPKDQDAVRLVKDMTGGYGCDVYIEASGNPASVNTGLQMIRKLGTFVEFSVFNEPATVNWTVIGDTKELNIHGSHLGPYCYPKTIAAIADGSLNVKPLIAEAYPLTAFHDAMEAALSGGVMKNMIVPV